MRLGFIGLFEERVQLAHSLNGKKLDSDQYFPADKAYQGELELGNNNRFIRLPDPPLHFLPNLRMVLILKWSIEISRNIISASLSISMPPYLFITGRRILSIKGTTLGNHGSSCALPFPILKRDSVYRNYARYHFYPTRSRRHVYFLVYQQEWRFQPPQPHINVVWNMKTRGRHHPKPYDCR